MQATYTISQEHVRLAAERPIRVQRMEVGSGGVKAHDHEFYELVLVRRGGAYHCTRSGRRRLAKGDFLALAPGQVHAFEGVEGFEVYNVYYLSEWVLGERRLIDEAPRLCMLFGGAHLFPDRIPQEPLHASLSREGFERTERELGLLEELSRGGAMHPLLAKGAALKCFAWWEEELGEQGPLEYEFLRHPLVRHVLDSIERSLADGQPCSVMAWARAAGRSPDHLTRLFRAQTGESPVSCFQRRRLQQAAHALIYSDENLSEIAHRLGFSDSAHFSRRFREGYGMSPKRYRGRFR